MNRKMHGASTPVLIGSTTRPIAAQKALLARVIARLWCSRMKMESADTGLAKARILTVATLSQLWKLPSFQTNNGTVPNEYPH